MNLAVYSPNRRIISGDFKTTEVVCPFPGEYYLRAKPSVKKSQTACSKPPLLPFRKGSVSLVSAHTHGYTHGSVNILNIRAYGDQDFLHRRKKDTIWVKIPWSLNWKDQYEVRTHFLFGVTSISYL